MYTRNHGIPPYKCRHFGMELGRNTSALTFKRVLLVDMANRRIRRFIIIIIFCIFLFSRLPCSFSLSDRRPSDCLFKFQSICCSASKLIKQEKTKTSLKLSRPVTSWLLGYFVSCSLKLRVACYWISALKRISTCFSWSSIRKGKLERIEQRFRKITNLG